MNIVFRLTDQHDADVMELGRKLGDYNSAHVTPSQKQPLSILAHDGDNGLVAGVSGETAWGWLYVRWLWVNESHRGKRIAATLLKDAEAEASARGCVGAHIDTFNPHALSVYKRQGYRMFGEIPDYVSGQTRTYLQKRWG